MSAARQRAAPRRPAPPRRPDPARRRAVVRRRVFALAALAAGAAVVVAAIAGGGGRGTASRPRPPAFVRVSLGGRVLAARRVGALRRPGSVAALLGAVPATGIVRRGTASIEMRTNRAELAREVDRAVAAGGGVVAVPQQATAATIRVPLVHQALRDNCETASLAMLLAYRGRRVDQLVLQEQVAHSQPLDPTAGPDGAEVWGDPSLGFVGRADGGGPGGGFGVYQGPIAALARRHGVTLRDLTGKSPAAVYTALLAGHPVMVWVALASGPFASWRTPAGRTVRINWGEHAVVLTGFDGEEVDVNDPLSGQRLTWSRAQFEAMWAALGRRALAA